MSVIADQRTRTNPLRAALDALGRAMSDERFGRVAALIGAYCIIWTLALTAYKYGQDIHFDSAEAYGWGLQFAWGYGKHPPLTGWVAGLWFRVLPASDWAMYALAMTIIGVGMLCIWRIARYVLDPTRSLMVVFLLMIYPIFNLKGFKFNPDQLQLATLPLMVLAFFHAFSTRTIVSGILLGLACAAAILTKYWAILTIGAIGLAALAHRDRLVFLASATPYVAVLAFAVGVAPHLIWLIQTDFAPFQYASRYLNGDLSRTISECVRAFGHHLALLASIPLVLALVTWPWRRNPAQAAQQSVDARHVWIILACSAVMPTIVVLVLRSRMKSDWDIPMFFLAPIALLLVSRMIVDRLAIRRAAICAATFTAVCLIGSPIYAWLNFISRPNASFFEARSETAKAVTALWHAETDRPIPTVTGDIPEASAVSFYSVDHPVMLSEVDPRVATWVDLNKVLNTGLLGLCKRSDMLCSMTVQGLIPDARRVEITTHKTLFSRSGPPNRWNVWLYDKPSGTAVAQETESYELSAARRSNDHHHHPPAP